jgi:hypothetical protein
LDPDFPRPLARKLDLDLLHVLREENSGGEEQSGNAC